MRDGSTRGGTKVQNTRARANVDVIRTTGNGSAKLASEGVPKSVLDLGGGGCAVAVLDGLVNADALLAVDGLAGGQVAGCNAVLLAATDDEDTGVAVRLLVEQTGQSNLSLLEPKVSIWRGRISTYNDNLGTALHATRTTASTTAATSSSTTGRATTAAATARATSSTTCDVAC